MDVIADYVPLDRRHALWRGRVLPEHAEGAALFADLSGFTAATETLSRVFGAQRGAEELIALINQIFSALIAKVDAYAGSVIGFAGDAITCWFDDDLSGDRAVLRAAACGLAMQSSMVPFQPVTLDDGPKLFLALKVSLAAGSVRRLLVGDPNIQRIEVLAGTSIARLGAAADQTHNGEVLADHAAAALLDGVATLGEIRHAGGIVCSLVRDVIAQRWPSIPAGTLSAEQLRPWLLPPVYQKLRSGQGEFLAELRYTVSLFLHFAELDYDADQAAGQLLDTFICWVQQVLQRYAGALIQLSMGEKGSYLYATFGAPVAHGDDVARAVAAALILRAPPPELSALCPIRIGIDGGESRTGAVGGGTRTYNVMGAATNLAARLMQHAAPGQVLIGAGLASSVSRRYALEPLPLLKVKGKADQIAVVELIDAVPTAATQLPELPYASILVGRSAELAVIAEKIALAASGDGQALSIIGEAGVGKSRLAAELTRAARQAGFVGYGGAAQISAAQTPYAAWVPVWRAFFALDSNMTRDEQAAALAQALAALDPDLPPRMPLLGPLLRLDLPPNELTAGLDPKQAKAALEDLILRCLRARCAAPGARLLLLLEDVQWLDALSYDLLVTISQACAGMATLLVITGRSAEIAGMAPLTFGRLPHGAEIALAELGQHESTRLAEQQIAIAFGPQAAMPAEIVAAIVERAAGNPFYIEELINYLRDRGVDLRDPAALAYIEPFGSLGGIILSRVDRLSVSQQTTLKIASVVGRVFPAAWLWGVHPDIGPVAQVHADLEHLARLDITPLDTPEPELRYLFKHATLQEVVYASLPFAQRALLHEQLAAWIETTMDEAASLDLLAFHYGRSTNVERQRRYFAAAAAAAVARYDNQAAALYYGRLLPLLPADERAPALLALGDALELLSAWDAAEVRYHQVLAEADGPDAARLRAQAAYGIGNVMRSRWQAVEASMWLQEARRAFNELGDDLAAMWAVLRLANVAWQRGDLDEAQALLEERLPFLEQSSERRLLAYTYYQLGNVASSRPDLVAASAWWRQSLELRRAIGDREGAAVAMDQLAMVAMQESRLDEAQGLASEASATFRTIGARREYGLSRDILAAIALGRGDVAEARNLVIANFDLYRDLGAQMEFAVSLIGLAEVLLAGGEPGELREAVTLVGLAQNLHDSVGGTMLPLHQGRVARIIKAVQRDLGDEATTALWAAGQGMDWAEAIVYSRRFH